MCGDKNIAHYYVKDDQGLLRIMDWNDSLDLLVKYLELTDIGETVELSGGPDRKVRVWTNSVRKYYIP